MAELPPTSVLYITRVTHDCASEATLPNPDPDAFPDEAFISPLCTQSTAAFALHLELRRSALIAIGCRRWDCEQCGPIKKSQLVARIKAAKPTKFITLTCRHESGPQVQLKKITKALPRLITRIRKTQPIEYFRMLEDCVDGYPHYHLLARTDYIHQAELSALWLKVADAPVVDIRKAHGASTAYIAKYLAKACNQNREWQRQRVSVSRHFWTRAPPAEQQWIDWRQTRRTFLEEAERISETRDLIQHMPGTYWIADKDDRPMPIEITQLKERLLA